MIRLVGALAAIIGLSSPARAAGRPITEGPHAMASTPAVPPAQAVKGFTVPPGFEVRLFAAEPDVINPVAMTWDERGRLWVLELFQYPAKAKKGERGKDRIKILEDRDNDGRADKVTIFAEGLDLATGLVRYGRGVLVGQAPELLYLEDTNGDDVADRRSSLLGGFSVEDAHELLNGFTWGPDGWLYMTHGVFNRSKVKAADGHQEVEMDAAVARFDPRGKRFEVFADGTSNPWGVDFDREGNAFVSACVIDHLFHMAPGGVYVRQAGTPGDPYAYDLLPSIVEHNHFRAAYAGVQIYQGDSYPASYRGMIVFGNIHSNAVNRDRLIASGASFRGEEQPDFLKSDDPWFRPVSEQVGPDGNLWIADWYDRYPCYQNAKADPEGVDRTHGRIWRVVYTGPTPGAVRGSVRSAQTDLLRARTDELVKRLSDPNVWHRRTAQRVLSERRDAAAKPALIELAKKGASLEARLAALWTLHGAGLLDDPTLDLMAGDREPALRTWAARLTGERDEGAPAQPSWPRALERLTALARDTAPTVRAGVAAALRRMSGRPTDAAVQALLEQPGTADDRVLTFLIWRAAEPRVATAPGPMLTWLRERGSQALPVSAVLARRTMRRLYDTGDAARLDEAVGFLSAIATADVRLVAASVEGLLEGQRGSSLRPKATAHKALRPLLARREPELAASARQLAAMWGDPAAARAVLAAINSRDKQIGDRQRIASVEIAASIPGPQAQRALARAFGDAGRPAVASAAIRALGKSGAAGTSQQVIARWSQLPPQVRTAAIDVLASRPAWAADLLTAVERKRIPAVDVPVSVRRALTRGPDKTLRARVEAVFGRMRDSSSEMQQLIAQKKAVMLKGPVDFEDGRVQAERTCLLCHRFYGTGGEVGPDLTGVGRATLDALLSNVIDPNQVIGKGYEQVTVSTKDGRTISGRVVEDSAERVTVVGLNLRETIPRAQIASVDVSDVSVMPEGLENLPDDAFRNLMWYVYQPPQDPQSRLRVELREKKLVVLHRPVGAKGWSELLTYVVDPALRPYIHPLRDPSGRHELTADRPSDHVWQHGVFTGLHKVNGVDFWTEKKGRQRFVRLIDLQQEPDRVLWKALVEWVAPDGQVLLEEEQAITVFAPTGAKPQGYTIDFDWRVRARGQAVTIGKHEYGGLSVRMPLHERHTHLNASGETGKAADTKRAAWTTVERPFDDGSVWGVAVFDHPSNERHPAAWRVDKQGLINPSPSIQGDWILPEWKSKTFRYRLQVFEGPASEAKLRRAYESFAALPAPVRPFKPAGRPDLVTAPR